MTAPAFDNDLCFAGRGEALVLVVFRTRNFVAVFGPDLDLLVDSVTTWGILRKLRGKD
jgi:hypothetical protein